MFGDTFYDVNYGVSGIASDGDGFVRALYQDAFGSDYVARGQYYRVSQGDGAKDKIVGDALVDVMHGGAGDDTLVGSPGRDELFGDAGIDTASYASSGAAVQVDLSVTGPQTSTGDAQGDTLALTENVFGSSFADSLMGNDA